MAGTYARTDCMPLDKIGINMLLVIKNHVRSEKNSLALEFEVGSLTFRAIELPGQISMRDDARARPLGSASEIFWAKNIRSEDQQRQNGELLLYSFG
jgi:hypothetical protein